MIGEALSPTCYRRDQATQVTRSVRSKSDGGLKRAKQAVLENALLILAALTERFMGTRTNYDW